MPRERPTGAKAESQVASAGAESTPWVSLVASRLSPLVGFPVPVPVVVILDLGKGYDME